MAPNIRLSASTVACETHTSGSSAFYAGYFTGESYKTATTIYGGTFRSVSRTAGWWATGTPLLTVVKVRNLP